MSWSASRKWHLNHAKMASLDSRSLNSAVGANKVQVNDMSCRTPAGLSALGGNKHPLID